jgi:PAS domain S-box-containing protein
MASREFEQELEKRVIERTAELIKTAESLNRQIADRKGMEGELKDTRARLQHVLAVTPSIIYTNQASGDYACTFVSESLKAIMGYTPHEMLDDPDFWTTHLHPQDARHTLPDVFRLLAQGGGTVEYRFRHADGHYRWFQDTFKVINDEAGCALEIVGSWADITQRKLAESFNVLYQASLKIQEPLGLKKWGDEFLRKGQEVLHLDRLSIFLADTDGQWLRAVASTETAEPLTAIRVPIGPEGGGLAQAYLTRQSVVWDGQGAEPDGLRPNPPYDQIEAFRSRAFAIMPLVLQQGQAIGVLEAGWKFSRRPFDRATLEPLQLLATQATLALEHARLYAAAQPVLRRSLQLKEVYPAFAEAVKALLAYDRIGVVVPDGERLLMALSLAEPPLASWQGESWPKTKGTAVDWVLTNRRPRLIRDLLTEQAFSDDAFMIQEGIRATLMLPLLAGDKPVGVFFLDSRTAGAYTERDLDLVDPVAQQLALAIENAQLFREIEEKSRQVEIANQHKSAFLANVSHELRTPLNAVIGCSEMLAARHFGELTAKQAEYVNDIRTSGKHLLALINDILDLSKIEAGRMELDAGVFDLCATLDNAAQLMRERAQRGGIELQVQTDRTLSTFRGDERKLNQVVLNLLSNAVKFTPPGGSVRMTAEALDGCVKIAVRDTGAGIAPEDQGAIFEAFRQVGSDVTRKREGTGLGLALVRRFVELHGGTIGVQSAPGEGSTFTVTLPLRHGG